MRPRGLARGKGTPDQQARGVSGTRKASFFKTNLLGFWLIFQDLFGCFWFFDNFCVLGGQFFSSKQDLLRLFFLIVDRLWQILGGGFKYFLFSPLLGETIHFDQYFSNGLKPPTRIFMSFSLKSGWEFGEAANCFVGSCRWVASGVQRWSIWRSGRSQQKTREKWRQIICGRNKQLPQQFSRTHWKEPCFLFGTGKSQSFLILHVIEDGMEMQTRTSTLYVFVASFRVPARNLEVDSLLRVARFS